MNPRHRIYLWALAALAVALTPLAALAAEPKPSVTREQLVTKVNASADARLAAASTSWRNDFSTYGSHTRLEKLGTALASIGEKFAQGQDAFSKNASPLARMRKLFGEHVVDIAQLELAMQLSFDKFEEQLVGESIEVYVGAGIDRRAAEAFFAHYRYSYTPPADAFDPLLKKAHSLAQSDWFRSGATFMGSGLLADELYGRPEQNTWADQFARFVLQTAVDAVLEEVTDPSERFAKELAEEFDRAESQLLDGPNGVLEGMKKLVRFHQQVRREHLCPQPQAGE